VQFATGEPFSKKATVPEGAGPEVASTTTDSVGELGQVLEPASPEVNVAVVADGVTTSWRAELADEEKSADELVKVATIEGLPASKVPTTQVADPAMSVTAGHKASDPELKTTDPAGVPPGLATVALKVTGAP